MGNKSRSGRTVGKGPIEAKVNEDQALVEAGEAPEGFETPKVDPEDLKDMDEVTITEFVDDDDKVVSTQLGEVVGKRSVPDLLIRYIGKVQKVVKEDILDEETGKVKHTRGSLIEVVAEPEEVPTVLINGTRRIELPSGEEQLAGFQHEDAMFLLNNYRDKFKKVVAKDGSRVAAGTSGEDTAGADAENAATEAQGEGAGAQGVDNDAE
jgi:hypothetical protein